MIQQSTVSRFLPFGSLCDENLKEPRMSFASSIESMADYRDCACIQHSFKSFQGSFFTMVRQVKQI